MQSLDSVFHSGPLCRNIVFNILIWFILGLEIKTSEFTYTSLFTTEVAILLEWSTKSCMWWNTFGMIVCLSPTFCGWKILYCLATYLPTVPSKVLFILSTRVPGVWGDIYKYVTTRLVGKSCYREQVNDRWHWCPLTLCRVLLSNISVRHSHLHTILYNFYLHDIVFSHVISTSNFTHTVVVVSR